MGNSPKTLATPLSKLTQIYKRDPKHQCLVLLSASELKWRGDTVFVVLRKEHNKWCHICTQICVIFSCTLHVFKCQLTHMWCTQKRETICTCLFWDIDNWSCHMIEVRNISFVDFEVFVFSHTLIHFLSPSCNFWLIFKHFLTKSVHFLQDFIFQTIGIGNFLKQGKFLKITFQRKCLQCYTQVGVFLKVKVRTWFWYQIRDELFSTIQKKKKQPGGYFVERWFRDMRYGPGTVPFRPIMFTNASFLKIGVDIGCISLKVLKLWWIFLCLPIGC